MRQQIVESFKAYEGEIEIAGNYGCAGADGAVKYPPMVVARFNYTDDDLKPAFHAFALTVSDAHKLSSVLDKIASEIDE